MGQTHTQLKTCVAFLTLYTTLEITMANILKTILLGQLTSKTHKNILYDKTIPNKFLTKILLGQIGQFFIFLFLLFHLFLVFQLFR